MAGMAFGTARLQNIRKRPAPSIRAASSSSVGNDWKTCRIRKTPNASDANGIQSAWSVFTNPSCCRRMKRGMMSTIGDTIRVEITAENSSSRPGKRIRAKAYPASVSSVQRVATTASATTALFANHRANGAWRMTVR